MTEPASGDEQVHRHAQAGTRPVRFAIVKAKGRPSRSASTARVRIPSVMLLRGGTPVTGRLPSPLTWHRADRDYAADDFTRC